MTMNNYLHLFRVKHYVKNILIFLPVFFSGNLFNPKMLLLLFPAFFAFCFMTSAIYIFNDICDIEADKKHPTRKKRPLAANRIQKFNAFICMFFCVLLSVSISVYLGNLTAIFLLFLYFIINIFYSKILKKIPVIDIVVLVSFYLLRLYYGGVISHVIISQWLYLVIMSGSFYLVLGKRRNELLLSTESRDVLKYYSKSFLCHNMYVCSALTVVFYALWTINVKKPEFIWTTPFLILLLMYYSFIIESNSDGDPVEVIFNNKKMFLMVLIFTICIFTLIYF